MPDDVWKKSPVHVEGLHADATRNILGGITDAAELTDTSPIGFVVRGQAGAGKTHLLGWVREQVHHVGGYFFLVGSPSETAFWESVAGAIRSDLLRKVDGGRTQLASFLRRLSELLGVPDSVRDAVAGDTELGPNDLKDFVVAFLRGVDRRLRDCQFTLRALVLFNSLDFEAQDVGESYLMSLEEQEPGERASRGMRPDPRSPRQIVSDLCRLLALTGPIVMAVDQIDTIVAARTTKTTGSTEGTLPAGPEFDKLADGLVVMRDLTARTLLVVSCLPSTWAVFEQEAVGPVADRFRTLRNLDRIASPEIGREIAAKHVGACYQRIGFVPAYPTWPVKPAAFEDAPGYTPRSLLQRIHRHVEACLSADKYLELSRLDDESPVVGPPVTRPAADLTALDTTFAALRAEVADTITLSQENEDTVIPALLSAGLTAWKAERGAAGQSFAIDSPPGPKPALHARLRLSLDETVGDEAHWCFRAVTSTHGNAALKRLRDACTQSDFDHADGKRRLILIRNTLWSEGTQTQRAVKAFTNAGGLTLPLSHEEAVTFAALGKILMQNHPDLREWLIARQWATRTALFTAALGDAAATTSSAPALQTTAHQTTEPKVATTNQTATQTTAPRHTATTNVRVPRQHPGPDVGTGGSGQARPARPTRSSRITIGVDMANQQAVDLPLEILRRHTAIFAGSGSGKTVLIRRLVEECALRGVSSIVLDPNNDLARLGEAWPDPPNGWGTDDTDLAKEYLDQTDVVVWTPRINAGRPLTFQPLPDFHSVRDNHDELQLALDAATTTLAAKAGVTGTAGRAKLGQAVLREALAFFARSNRTTLASFVDLLSDLPDGVTNLDHTGKVARGLAQSLEAEMVIDPMFGGTGMSADPGVLLTPPTGKRARVSVISFVGLPDSEHRQNFVSQLQLALFAWAKKNPASERPLSALFVMDEAQTFAPATGATACTKSTLMVSSQIRKYGVGLVFATQAPKGLHSQISGNAATQFFGLLSAPVHIEAAREMARAKGGDASQIGRLKVGQFYAASDGIRFRKIQTPLCLSHHPSSPLTEDEVVQRARGGS